MRRTPLLNSMYVDKTRNKTAEKSANCAPNNVCLIRSFMQSFSVNNNGKALLLNKRQQVKQPNYHTLMEIKGFSQCIAANKQQWCSLVAAASCSIVVACEFFVCKLVLLLLVAATLRLLVAATLRLLVAATLQLLVAATLQLFVCRECVGLVVDCF